MSFLMTDLEGTANFANTRKSKDLGSDSAKKLSSGTVMLTREMTGSGNLWQNIEIESSGLG